MASARGFIILSIALIAFFGTKVTFAIPEEVQLKGIESKPLVFSTDEQNGSPNALKTAEDSFSIIKNVSSQHLPDSKNTSGGERANEKNSTRAEDSVIKNSNKNKQAGTFPQKDPSSVSEERSSLSNSTNGNSDSGIGKIMASRSQNISPESHGKHGHISTRGISSPYSQSPEVTAMLAGIFVAFALMGYFGLVCWRRALEKRYGNRELLVEEEEFNSSYD